MLMSCATPGSASDPAAIRVAKNKTLRGNAGGFTKGSSDGPAMTPSRLRDSQSRSSAGQVQVQERGSRCGTDGQVVFPAQPVERPARPAGARRPQAVAPSRLDSGRHSTVQELK